ncbi:indole-3-glycerol phosphate synthase TrpC [Mucilaginibacter sp.]
MTILDRIVQQKQKEVEAGKNRFSYMRLEEAEHFHRTPYSLKQFLTDPARTGIIAEFKRRSPSKGVINGEADVMEVTQAYNAAGASALSVLTDLQFFMGRKRDLTKARRVNDIPILRKDFMIDEYQIVEAKAIGADIILLIAAILTPEQIKRFADLAKGMEMSVLLEVHNLEELQRSLTPNLDAIGVNNRNLADFTVSVDTSFQLAEHIPNDFLKVSESAISDPAIINQLRQAGFNGFLIGENFMKQAEPGRAMEAFVREMR